MSDIDKSMHEVKDHCECREELAKAKEISETHWQHELSWVEERTNLHRKILKMECYAATMKESEREARLLAEIEELKKEAEIFSEERGIWPITLKRKNEKIEKLESDKRELLGILKEISDSGTHCCEDCPCDYWRELSDRYIKKHTPRPEQEKK